MNLTKYKLLLLFSLGALLSNPSEIKADVAQDFNNLIYEKNVTGSYPYQEKRMDIGLFYDFAWNKYSKKIIIKRDKQNYPLTRFSLFNKKDFNRGTSVKKYNNINLSEVSDKKIKELHKENKTANITLSNNKTITLKPYSYSYNDVKLSSFNLEFINNIDTNKGLLEVSFKADFTNKRPELNKWADGLLKKEKLYEAIYENGPWPIRKVEIKEYKYDIDIRKGINTPDTGSSESKSLIFFTYDNEEVKTIREESGIGQFRQVFNFQKFPFDKQSLKFKITSGKNSKGNLSKSEVHFITPEKGAYLGLENYLNNVSDNYLKEWTVKSIDIESDEIVNKNYYDKYSNKTYSYHENSINLVLNIKRNSAHYIYKIIVPVFLILSIAWFVLWIPTEKLDARLTTSIVALLSLIAYNFVFSDDIPKLDYLTALDEYILLSYIFCAMPTFMSILFSRFILKNQKKVILINKKLRTWLGIIYLLFTIQIFSF